VNGTNSQHTVVATFDPSVTAMPDLPAATGGDPIDTKKAVDQTEKDLTRRPEGRDTKIKALLDGGSFSYFRGTSPQFFRELLGKINDKNGDFASLKDGPRVKLSGDGHAENIGAKKGADGTMSLVMTDVDDASEGNAALDIVRSLAATFPLLQGASKEAMDAFLNGYLEGVADVKAPPNPPRAQSKLTTSMLADAKSQKIEKRLDKADPKLLKMKEGMTRVSDKQEGKDIAAALEKQLGLPAGSVTDVVSDTIGTASSDLKGYRCVAGGRIYEMKEMLGGPGEKMKDGTLNQQLQGAGSGSTNDDALSRYNETLKAFQGNDAPEAKAITVGKQTFIVRERAPEKNNVDVVQVLADFTSGDPAKRADALLYIQEMGRIVGKGHGSSGDGEALTTFVNANRDKLINLSSDLGRQSGDEFKEFKTRHGK
jgi:hypothetical protein